MLRGRAFVLAPKHAVLLALAALQLRRRVMLVPAAQSLTFRHTRSGQGGFRRRRQLYRVEQEFEGPVGLASEGDFGPEEIDSAFADLRFHRGDTTTQVALAPSPAAAQRIGLKPGQRPDPFQEGVRQ